MAIWQPIVEVPLASLGTLHLVGDLSRAWLALVGSCFAWHGGRCAELLLWVYKELDGITIRLLEPAGLVIWIWGRAE